MKLNLGCGPDRKEGYLNVDFRKIPGVDEVVDLSKLPWPFASDSADEILMLDFLEHFPYRKTEPILQECWRVLRMGGKLAVQVPDLDHCARAACRIYPYLCNRCGHRFSESRDFCVCGQSQQRIAQAARERLMGGQDYEGNTHLALFSEESLCQTLNENGFGGCTVVQLNENGESYFQNWNVRVDSVKKELSW